MYERRSGQCVLRIGREGAFSFLSADGRTGWRGLGFSAVVNGKEVVPAQSRLIVELAPHASRLLAVSGG